MDFITIIDGCPASDGLMVTRKVGVSFSFVWFDGRSVTGTVGSWGLIDFIFLISRELSISYNMNFKFSTNQKYDGIMDPRNLFYKVLNIYLHLSILLLLSCHWLAYC